MDANSHPTMEILDDDEPEVIYDSTKTSKSKKRRQRNHRRVLVPDPVVIPTAATVIDDEVQELPVSVEHDSPKLYNRMYSHDDTVILSDSDEEMNDIKPGPEVIGHFNQVHDQPETIPFEFENLETTTADHTRDEESMTLDPAEGEDEENGIEIEDVTPPELLHAARVRQAEELKELGNKFFMDKEYHKALDLYNRAIDALPTEATFYGNRSACYLMLKKYKNAQADARTSVQIDPTFEKGYSRLIRSNLALGDTVGAEGVMKTLRGLKIPDTKVFIDEERKINHLKALRNEIRVLKEKKDFRTLLFHTERALIIAEGDLELKMIKADALLHLNRTAEAQELCTDVLQIDSMCVDAYIIRSICLYEADNLEKGVQFLRQALQFAPDSPLILSLFRKMKKIKEVREEATGLFSKGKYADAKLKFLDCINSVKEFDFPNATIESKMSMNLSLIAVKLGDTDEALKLVNRALDLNSNYLKALLHRAQVHKTKELFDEAVRDYELAQKIDPRNNEYRKYIQDAKLAAKKAKRKDYYKILGVDKNASPDEVKKAYKKRALIHHPDRHATATETMKKEQEKQFKDLGQAYEILSDPKKRNRYDAGHDLDSPEGGFGQGDFDPSNLFNVFFGGSGGGGMGGGCPRSSGFQQQQHRTYSNFHPY